MSRNSSARTRRLYKHEAQANGCVQTHSLALLEVAYFLSPVGTAAGSLGRKPQENRTKAKSSPEGATQGDAFTFVSPLQGFPVPFCNNPWGSCPRLSAVAASRLKGATSKLALRTCMLTLCMCLLLSGCERDMADQPKYEPYEASKLFADGQASREPVEGTVARGRLKIDEHFFTGKIDGKVADTFPQLVTEQTLLRGQQRYNIFCSQCHSPIGNGQGMVVRRGFPRPPSYHIPRLREAPVGYFYDVITNGFGRMSAHGYLMPPEDRWAIAAYIRALQKSQHAERDELSAEDLKRLEDNERE